MRDSRLFRGLSTRHLNPLWFSEEFSFLWILDLLASPDSALKGILALLAFSSQSKGLPRSNIFFPSFLLCFHSHLYNTRGDRNSHIQDYVQAAPRFSRISTIGSSEGHYVSPICPGETWYPPPPPHSKFFLYSSCASLSLQLFRNSLKSVPFPGCLSLQCFQQSRLISWTCF